MYAETRDQAREAITRFVTEYGSRREVPYAGAARVRAGPVVIGEMGGGTRSEVLALGDTTNIAARLEAERAARRLC